MSFSVPTSPLPFAVSVPAQNGLFGWCWDVNWLLVAFRPLLVAFSALTLRDESVLLPNKLNIWQYCTERKCYADIYLYCCFSCQGFIVLHEFKCTISAMCCLPLYQNTIKGIFWVMCWDGKVAAVADQLIRASQLWRNKHREHIGFCSYPEMLL